MRIAMRILLVSSVSPDPHRSTLAADPSMAPPPLFGADPSSVHPLPPNDHPCVRKDTLKPMVEPVQPLRPCFAAGKPGKPAPLFGDAAMWVPFVSLCLQSKGIRRNDFHRRPQPRLRRKQGDLIFSSQCAIQKTALATELSCNMVEPEGNPENCDSQMGETETKTAQTEIENEQQQPQQEVKKRKTMAPRSDVWESFSKIKVGDILKAKCKHCSRELRCDPRTNGTSSLNSHLRICKRNPNRNTDSKQGTLQVHANKEDSSNCTISTWKFDPEGLREAFAEMIITDELPFAFCEREGFKKFMSKACPRFCVPSRRTTTRDSVRTYNNEKAKLKQFLKDSCERVSLTTDTWTSNTQQNYMCVTAHFIDNDWKLHKKIIGFFLVKGHKGEDIGKSLEKCLMEWCIEKVFTVTVDNASSNDSALNYMRKVLNNSNRSIAKSKYIHMRCAAHIINLIVSDGLKELSVSIQRVRAAVKFIKNSPSRISRFKKCAELAKVDSKAFLSLDVCTRWNSTYLMLNAASIYENVFERYGEEDPYYAIELCSEKGHGVPESGDWENAKKMIEFLGHFYKLTLRVSATHYVTSNILFHEIGDVLLLLRQWCHSDDDMRKEMGQRMLQKYYKYWGDKDKLNMLMFIAVALDPRYKLSNYTNIATLEMFGEEEGKEVWNNVNDSFRSLFDEYRKLYAPSDKAPQSSDSQEPVGRSTRLMKSLIAEKMRMNNTGTGTSKSELEKYLSEDNEEDSENFDILEWWKCNSPRFPILSHLARDILAVPISTVASESAFSTGGRVLDDFRSSLTPFMVQCLVCTQDWLRRSLPINIEEDPADLAKIEEAIIAEDDENSSKEKSKSESITKPSETTS